MRGTNYITTSPERQLKMDVQNHMKRLSIRNKLILIFGMLITFALLTLGFLAVRIAQKAVKEKVETHLIDKATDTAKIVDDKLDSFFNFLHGISYMHFIPDQTFSFDEKAEKLQELLKSKPEIVSVNIFDRTGRLYTHGEKVADLSHQQWYKATMQGKDYVSEPFVSAIDGKLIIFIAIPLYNTQNSVQGALGVALKGQWLSDQIKDIVVGKTGYCYILEANGNLIAHQNFDIVKNKVNMLEKAKSDVSLQSLADVIRSVLAAQQSEIRHYDFNGIKAIASFAKIQSTGWTVIITASLHEFMGTVETLRKMMIIIGFAILITVLIIVWWCSKKYAIVPAKL